MQLRLTFSEIQKMISDKTGQEIPISYGGEHTLRISYSKFIMKMTLDLTVERVLGSDIRLSYGGSLGVETMVQMALNQVKDRPEVAGMLETLDGSHIVLHLGMNPQLAQIFDRIILQDIRFDEEFVIIEFVPKAM